MEDVFNAWCSFLNPEYKGKFFQSMDVNPIGKNKIEYNCLYSPREKKVIKPSKAMLTMYARNNKESAEIAEMLMGDYGRLLEHVSVTGHSYFEAILYQISRDRNKYKPKQFMQQIAYYMAKWPQRFYDLVRPYLGTHLYESYIKNIFHGTKFIDYEVITAVITKMWNLAITTGRERLIRSHSSARFCFELSGNSN